MEDKKGYMFQEKWESADFFVEMKIFFLPLYFGNMMCLCQNNLMDFTHLYPTQAPYGGTWVLVSVVVKSLGPGVSQGGSPGPYTH